MSTAQALQEIQTVTSKMWGNWDSYRSVKIEHPSGGYRFPISLPDDRPVLKLSCNQIRTSFGSSPAVIWLPAPGGLSFDNVATYDDAELGLAGAAALGAFRGAQNDNLNEKIKSAVVNAGNTPLLNMIVGVGVRELAGADSGVGRAIGIGSRSSLNKNVTTEFTGVGTREFSFAYKLVPSSKKESEVVKGIIQALTLGLYPEISAGGAILKYPPTWTVEVLKSVNGDRIEGVPKIFECYLRAFASNYNEGSNSYFSDGTPVEVDITLGFKETRALTAQDISQLL